MFIEGDGLKLLNCDFAKSIGILLGRDANCEIILKRAIEEKKKLKNELSEALVSIKFDGVTRLRSQLSAHYSILTTV